MPQTKEITELINKITLQPLVSLSDADHQVDMLRLDLFHPVICGNKWFKLQYYLAEAIKLKKQTIASFGGAYSNHIVATAYAANCFGLVSLGIIRGEENELLSPTLQEAKLYGMQFQFLNRQSYPEQSRLSRSNSADAMYWIPEGGYGALGANGASTILNIHNSAAYSHIVCAVGTGTMMAGLMLGSLPHQQIVGISVLKNHLGLAQEIRQLLPPEKASLPIELHANFHFGGYAKKTPELLANMTRFWEQEKIPTDFVYTGKMVFGVQALLANNYFPAGSRILLIHSGGLQGNRSIAQGILPF